MRDTKTQLTLLTRALHWIVGITIIVSATMGIYMNQTEDFDLYPIHKSIGVLIFFVIVVRVYWRFINGWPQIIAKYQPIEHQLTQIVHWLLIIATVIMPISGFIMSGAGGYGVSVFGLEIIAINFDPIAQEVIPHNENLAKFMHEVHELTGWTMIFTIMLHIISALKHHIIDKDNTLKRMLGKF